jgi:hypothetical protein
MIPVIAAALCLLASVALWNSADKFRIDAAPVGSMMLAASVVLFGASLFMFGLAVGRLTYS